jgi:hypothetical protein
MDSTIIEKLSETGLKAAPGKHQFQRAEHRQDGGGKPALSALLFRHDSRATVSALSLARARRMRFRVWTRRERRPIACSFWGGVPCSTDLSAAYFTWSSLYCTDPALKAVVNRSNGRRPAAAPKPLGRVTCDYENWHRHTSAV